MDKLRLSNWQWQMYENERLERAADLQLSIDKYYLESLKENKEEYNKALEVFHNKYFPKTNGKENTKE